MSDFSIPQFIFNQTYNQFDVVYGISGTNTVHPTEYLYATRDVPSGYSPSGIYNYPITQFTRTDDIVTLNYTHSGGLPFGDGSIVRITGCPKINYTGMILEGGSGQIKFVNAGVNETQALSAGAINCYNPSWTTGHFFKPDYTSKFPIESNPIVTKLGSNYEQRMPIGLNTFNQTLSLSYKNVSKKQAKAMKIFATNNAGVWPTQLLIPDQFLTNKPNNKYVIVSIDIDPTSFERYDIQESVRRVFDI